MAYTTKTLVPNPAGYLESTFQSWTYISTDSLTTIQGAGYVSDASVRGMKVGDIVDCINQTGPKYIRQQVSAISSGAATLVTPTAIS